MFYVCLSQVLDASCSIGTAGTLSACSVRLVREGHGMTLEEKTETVRHLWMARWVISLDLTKAYFELVESVFYGHEPVRLQYY
jgi:hypothetical protein